MKHSVRAHPFRFNLVVWLEKSEINSRLNFGIRFGNPDGVQLNFKIFV
jgi:hypothetical protein